MDNTIDDRIKILQTRISVEHHPTTRQELNKQLRVLQLKKEIEAIQKRIAQLS